MPPITGRVKRVDKRSGLIEREGITYRFTERALRNCCIADLRVGQTVRFEEGAGVTTPRARKVTVE